MKKLVLQLLVGLLGCFVLVWGEAKHYIESHPDIISTFQLEAKRAEPLVYYNYQVAYDPNNGKTWYYYGDGNWYDRPPAIHKRPIQNQTPRPQVSGTGASGQGQIIRQATQATTYPTRY